jgi:hypothetical protein
MEQLRQWPPIQTPEMACLASPARAAAPEAHEVDAVAAKAQRDERILTAEIAQTRGRLRESDEAHAPPEAEPQAPAAVLRRGERHVDAGAELEREADIGAIVAAADARKDVAAAAQREMNPREDPRALERADEQGMQPRLDPDARMALVVGVAINGPRKPARDPAQVDIDQ